MSGAVELEQALSLLSPAHRVASCAAICQRLLPNYEAFSREAGWGSPDVLADALDLIWECVLGRDVLPTELDQISQKCFELGPEPGDFISIFASAALDAANAIATTARLCIKAEIGGCLEVFTYGRDTVDMFIQIHEGYEPDDPDLEQKIAQHPLMRRELFRQAADLRDLASQPIMDVELANRLRSSDESILNLDARRPNDDLAR